MATTGAGVGDLVLTVADEYRLTCHVLGALRLELGGRPVSEGPYRYLWVVDFPLFDGVDEDGNPVAAHHPFTMPHPDDIDRLTSDPASVRSQAYDLVLNGWELGSGSVRVHRADIQSQSASYSTAPFFAPPGNHFRQTRSIRRAPCSLAWTGQPNKVRSFNNFIM